MVCVRWDSPLGDPILPAALVHLMQISADADVNLVDNAMQPTTTVLDVPPPQRGVERLFIHPERQGAGYHVVCNSG
jgi:hypothetical protein